MGVVIYKHSMVLLEGVKEFAKDLLLGLSGYADIWVGLGIIITYRISLIPQASFLQTTSSKSRTPACLRSRCAKTESTSFSRPRFIKPLIAAMNSS